LNQIEKISLKSKEKGERRQGKQPGPLGENLCLGHFNIQSRNIYPLGYWGRWRDQLPQDVGILGSG
jgi:hypothetical protein